MTKLQTDLLLLLVTIVAAIGWLLSKSALVEIQPFWFIGIRFLVAAGCLTLFCLPSLCRLTRKDYLAGFLTGAVFGVAMMAWITGLNRSPHVGESSFIVSLGVTFVPFFAWALSNEKPSLSVIVSLPIAVVGLGFLNLEDTMTHGWHWNYAQLILLLSAVLIAFQFSLIGHLAKRIAPLPLTCIQLWVSGCIALIGAFLWEPFPASVSPSTWGIVMIAAVLCSSLRFFMQTKALQYVPAARAGMILLLEPVWVTLMGMQFFNQWLSTYQLLGCTLIFSALLIQKLTHWWYLKRIIVAAPVPQ